MRTRVGMIATAMAVISLSVAVVNESPVSGMVVIPALLVFVWCCMRLVAALCPTPKMRSYDRPFRRTEMAFLF